MAMKKFINDPNDLTKELLEGFSIACGDKIKVVSDKIVVRAQPKSPDKVALVTLGGAGHEPAAHSRTVSAPASKALTQGSTRRSMWSATPTGSSSSINDTRLSGTPAPLVGRVETGTNVRTTARSRSSER